MRRNVVVLIRYMLPLLAMGLVLLLVPSRMTQAATAVPTLRDEFNSPSLDPVKWTVMHGNPSLVNGKLVLAGGLNELAEIQSTKKFSYGVVQLSIISSSWKAQDQTTDSSFGFEIWGGTNGQCHYSVVLKANGHLGVMRAKPDASGNCSGDPEFQAHIPIASSDWDAVRAGKTLHITLTWSPRSVTLHITSGGSLQGAAYYFGTAEPTNLLEIRLNADKGETYRVDYVRAVGIPWR